MWTKWQWPWSNLAKRFGSVDLDLSPQCTRTMDGLEPILPQCLSQLIQTSSHSSSTLCKFLTSFCYNIWGGRPKLLYTMCTKCGWQVMTVFVNDSRVGEAEGICCNNHPQDCIDENLFGTKDIGDVYWSRLFILRWILLICFPSIYGHWVMSLLKEFASMNTSNNTCRFKKSFKQTAVHAKF